MAALNKTHILCIFSAVFSTHALAELYDCPGKDLIEISGDYKKTTDLQWNDAVIPDMFIVDPKGIIGKSPRQIQKVAKKYAFEKPESIIGYTIDDDSRAIAVYQTPLGAMLMGKILMKRARGARSCMPGSSIQGLFLGMPTALVHARGQEDKSKCMWQVEMLDIKNSVDYTIYHPVQCAQAPTKEYSLRLLETIKGLLPSQLATQR